jgi:hypothetical protein
MVAAVCLIVLGLIKGITVNIIGEVRRNDRPVTYWCWMSVWIIWIVSMEILLRAG